MTNYTLDIILTGWLMLYAISRNSFFFLLNLHFGKRLYSIITISCEKKYTCVRRTSLGEKSRLKSVRLSFEFSHVNVMLQFLTPSNQSFHFLNPCTYFYYYLNTNQQNFQMYYYSHTHLLPCIWQYALLCNISKKTLPNDFMKLFSRFLSSETTDLTKNSKVFVYFFEGCESWLTFFHT